MERETVQPRLQPSAEDLSVRCANAAHLFRTLSHPLRLQLLCLLGQGEAAVGTLQTMTCSDQSQVSQFLRRMEHEGWVASRDEGRHRYYRLAGPEVHALMDALEGVLERTRPPLPGG